MVLELVAGRIIAPYVGVSLYTWTTVIGVVLAGISLGNYLGGWLADRWASPRLLGLTFLLGGLACFGILAVDALGAHLPGHWPVVVQILVLTVALFFLPSALLGGVSPIVAKLAVQDLARTGSTVGRIYAAGAAGSIVGTFASGYVLIAQFGTHAIVWGVAVLLISMGLIFVLFGRGRLLVLLFLAAAIGGMAWAPDEAGCAAPATWRPTIFASACRSKSKKAKQCARWSWIAWCTRTARSATLHDSCMATSRSMRKSQHSVPEPSQICARYSSEEAGIRSLATWKLFTLRVN
jgi:MFS family permease